VHPELRQIGLLAALFGTVAAFSLTWLSPALRRSMRALRKPLAALAARRGGVALAVGCGVLMFRVALLPVWKLPTPSVPDEFSHLLLGDTLAHGRLANPRPSPKLDPQGERRYVTLRVAVDTRSGRA
jgi:hypothetical protein